MKKWRTVFNIVIVIAIALGGSILSFSKIYENLQTTKMKITIVNEDVGSLFNSSPIYFGEAFIRQVERDNTYEWTVSSRGIAENKIAKNQTDLVVIIPNNFSQKAIALNEQRPDKLDLNYIINPMSTFLKLAQTDATLKELKNNFNENLIEVYFSSILQNFDDIKLNLSEMKEEEILHEDTLVNGILVNVTKINENFMQVGEKSTADVSMFESLINSNTTHDRENDRNVANLNAYLTSFASFRDEYNNRRQKFSNFSNEYKIYNQFANEATHIEKLEAIEILLSELKTSFFNDTLVQLEQAKTKIDETNQNLSDNIIEIDDWLSDNGSGDKKLDDYYNNLMNEINTVSADSSTIKDNLEEKIKQQCQTNAAGVSTLSVEIKKVCTEVLNIQGSDSGQVSNFSGTSTFEIKDGDSGEIRLEILDTKNGKIAFDQSSITVCVNRNDGSGSSESYITKKSLSNVACIPEVVTANNFIDTNGDGHIDTFILRDNIVIDTLDAENLSTYITISYKILETDVAVNNRSTNVIVNQRLRIEQKKLENPIINQTSINQNFLTGTGYPNAIIVAKFCQNPTPLSCKFDGSTGIEISTSVDAMGNWTANFGTGVQFALNDEIIVKQSLMMNSDNEAIISNVTQPLNPNSYNNESEVVLADVKEVITPNVYTVLDGYSLIKSNEPVGPNADVIIKITDAANNEKIELTIQADNFGRWEIKSPIELFVGDKIILNSRNNNGVLSTTTTVVVTNTIIQLQVNQIFDENDNPTLFIPSNSVIFNEGETIKTIEGIGEPGAQISINHHSWGSSIETVLASTEVKLDGTWTITLPVISINGKDRYIIKEKFFDIQTITEATIDANDVNAPTIIELTSSNDLLTNNTMTLTGKGEPNILAVVNDITNNKNYCTLIDSNGDWTLDSTTIITNLPDALSVNCLNFSNNGIVPNDAFPGLLAGVDYEVYQQDFSNNVSPKLKLTIRVPMDPAAQVVPIILTLNDTATDKNLIEGTAYYDSALSLNAHVFVKISGNYYEATSYNNNNWQLDISAEPTIMPDSNNLVIVEQVCTYMPNTDDLAPVDCSQTAASSYSIPGQVVAITPTAEPQVETITNILNYNDLSISGTAEPNAEIVIVYKDLVTFIDEEYCTTADTNGGWLFDATTITTNTICANYSTDTVNPNKPFVGFNPNSTSSEVYEIYQISTDGSRSSKINLNFKGQTPNVPTTLSLSPKITKVMAPDGGGEIEIITGKRYYDTFSTTGANVSVKINGIYYPAIYDEEDWFVDLSANAITVTNNKIEIAEICTFFTASSDLPTANCATTDSSTFTLQNKVVIKTDESLITNSIMSIFSANSQASNNMQDINNLTTTMAITPRYFTAIKQIQLPNESLNQIEIEPNVVNHFLELYYGYNVNDILNLYENAHAFNDRTTFESYVVNNKKAAIYTLLYKNNRLDGGTLQLIQTELTEFHTNIKASLEKIRLSIVQSQPLLDETKELINAEIIRINGDGTADNPGRLAALDVLSNRTGETKSTLNKLQNDTNKLLVSNEDIIQTTASEGQLLFEVTDQHIILLEQSQKLSEQATNYLDIAIARRESAQRYVEQTEEYKAVSDSGLALVQQESAIIISNVERNGVFVDNVMSSFENSKINGIENTALYGFLSSPISIDSFAISASAGKSLFPYFMIIISFTLALLLAYVFTGIFQKVKINYEDEYVNDVIKNNLRYVGLLMSITVVISTITGIISGVMADITSWLLVIWIIFTVLFMNALSQIFYLLLRKLNAIGLTMIMSTLFIYLVSNQALGINIARGTVMETILRVSILTHLEKLFFNIMYELQANNLILWGATIIVIILGVLGNVFSEVYKANKIVKGGLTHNEK